MFTVLHREVSTLVAWDPVRLLEWLPTIYNWSHLGCFTGSRLGEYGQSKPKPGEPFAMVSHCADAREWAGMPLAFVRDDFTFYDAWRHYLATADLSHLCQYAKELHVHFRYDKSVLNFIICKYRWVHGSFMCLVDSTISILEHVDLLGVPLAFPIGIFLCPTSGTYWFLQGSDVSSVMQYACQMAYPDIGHYM